MFKSKKKAKPDLFGDDIEEERSENGFTVNEEYATRYSSWRNQEELQKLKQKYGNNPKDEESSTSESEDDEPQNVFDKEFYTAFACLKSKNPKIYDKNLKFFNESKDADTKKEEKPKKKKGLFLADYERETLLKYNGQLPDEEEENNELKKQLESKSSYEEEQKKIKDSFKKLVESNSDDDDEGEGLLKPRQKSQTEMKTEEDEYAEWLKGQKEDLGDGEVADEMIYLREQWMKPSLNEDDKFLVDYILNKKYIVPNCKVKNRIPTYDEIIKDSNEDDDHFSDEQDNFEHKYNFRFEEPDQEFIKRYPRTMKESLRRPDNRRSDKRLETNERKKKEKDQKREELKRLKALKRNEIMEQINKIKCIKGETKIEFENKDLEDDFNPDDYDAKMRAIFDEEYYNDIDEEKPEFPEDNFDEDYNVDNENWDEWTGAESQNYDKSECENKDLNMDGDFVPEKSSMELINETLKPKKKSRRKRNKLKEALKKRKPVFDPDDATYEQYLEEYYKLDYEDIIGDLPCRFKYRNVVPNDFGLNVEEVLAADDKELNKWCSLKKMTQYRRVDEEQYDVDAYAKKASNFDKKKKILRSVYEPEIPEEVKPSEVKEKKSKKNGKRKMDEVQDPASPIDVVTEEQPKKRKRKKKQVDTEEPILPESKPSDETEQPQKKKRKRKKKFQGSNGAKNFETTATITDDRADVVENGKCWKKDGDCGEEMSPTNKYNKDVNSGRWGEYLRLIEEARSNYIACNSTSCSCYQSVLKSDLSPWSVGGITKQMIDSARDKGTLYQIIDHKLYRDKECMFPFRCKGVEHFLLKLAPNLPDVEFVLNTRDWPQIPTHYEKLPIFSFSKTKDYYDIMYPAWTFWEGGPAIALYPTGLGRWDLHIDKIIEKSKKWPWSDKVSKGFFRGSRTSSERDALILLSREEPQLVDAQYTKNQAWKSDDDTLGQAPASEVPLEDHCQFKYLFNYRGVAASFRFKHLFLCKSLVLHVGNDWLEFFYPALKPWVHYIPLSSSSAAQKQKLKDILQFVKENDKIAEEIAEAGFNFIRNRLTLKEVTCYWRRLIRNYSKLLKFKVKLDPNVVLIG
ncbi:hypothetical protein CHUAL_006411 [Chamberlinius hualienensis]